MDKILFKGLDLKPKNKKPRSYIINTSLEDYSPVKLFDKEYQNILYPFIKEKVNCVVENYLSVNKIQDTIEALEFDGHDSILIVSTNKFETKYDIQDPNGKISVKKYTYVIMDNCFVKCRRPFVVLKKDVDIPIEISTVKFLYRHKFIDGTKQKMKHLVFDQLVDDPTNTLIYATDKQKLVDRFEDIKFVDDQNDEMFNCRRFIFYDLCENIEDFITRIEWSDLLTIFTIYIPEEKLKVKKYMEKIRDKVIIDKEIEKFINED